MAEFVTILTTTPSQDEARAIARLLVEQKLAACAQIMPIESFYRWQGNVVNDGEYLLLIKSRGTLFPAIETAIKTRHSYTVPEMICLPVIEGARTYLDWITTETDGPR